jgi:hypothetical protein
MRILIHGRHYPIAMWRWFDFAFRDLGHEVFSVGNWSGPEGKIPWGDDFRFPQYAFAPDHELPDIPEYDINKLLNEIDFKPDLVVQASDVSHLLGKSPILNVSILTDPHCVNYSERVKYSDHVFNMQHAYLEPGQTWLPYAYYPPVHRFISKENEYDVVFSGLQYDHRKEALEKMKSAGLKVFTTLGLLYEEYAQKYNSGTIAFNWSSKNDLPARFWEGLAMKRLVLTNKCPDLEQLEFIDGVDYISFSGVDDAVDKAVYYSNNKKEADKIAASGYKKVQKHTYLRRCEKILEVIGKL